MGKHSIITIKLFQLILECVVSHPDKSIICSQRLSSERVHNTNQINKEEEMDIHIGDKFQECDRRFTRIVTVTGFDKRGFVQLNGKTYANPKRFYKKWKSRCYMKITYYRGRLL